MSQLTIKLSVKADALIAQLQKEIFNRRRKKVSAAGVVETLVESGAKSQSDKRFATSWSNLIKDIEKAAKLTDTHGNKPTTLSDEEWAIVLTHRSRRSVESSKKPTKRLSKANASLKPRKSKSTTSKRKATKSSTTKPSTKKVASKSKTSTSKTTSKRASAPKTVAKKASSLKVKARKGSAQKAPATKTSTQKTTLARPARRAKKATGAKRMSTAPAKRVTKAASRLSSTSSTASVSGKQLAIA